ncbi:MAG TPA: hypothetical protein VIL85_05565 [Thermomicrobiales bacterium]|jgi:hypothetical protein
MRASPPGRSLRSHTSAWPPLSGEIRGRERAGGPDGTVSFHDIDPNTAGVTLEIAYEPDGAVEKIGSTPGCPQLRVAGDLRRFRTFIETTGQETDAWRGTVGEQPQQPDDDKDKK